MSIPTNIDLTLRAIKGSPLTFDEGDANFTNLRDAILAIAATIGASRVVIGAEPAAGERTGVLWIPADFKGAFVWDVANSRWKRIAEPVLYGVSTGSLGAYVLSLPQGGTVLNEIPDAASLTGKLIAMKANHVSPGPSTLQVNALAAFPIKQHGADALISGTIPNNGVALLLFDGTNFQLLNPKPAVASVALTKSFVLGSPVALPAGFSVVTTPHFLAEVPKVVRATLVNQVADKGYIPGEEVDVASLVHYNGSGADKPVPVSADANNIYVTFSGDGSNELYLQAKNADTWSVITDRTKWKLMMYAFA